MTLTLRYYATTNLSETNILFEEDDFLWQEEPVFGASPPICLHKEGE